MYEPKFLGRQLPPLRVDLTALDCVGKSCGRCKRDMVTKVCWAGLTRDERKLLKKDFVQVGARGLCINCYNSLSRTNPDALLDYERTTSVLTEFAENLLIYRRRTNDKHQLAKLSGMSVPTFDKALDRAKKAGLL
jgi:hypothetical protein